MNAAAPRFASKQICLQILLFMGRQFARRLAWSVIPLASLALCAAGTTITVAVNPSTASLAVGRTQTFSAVVSGTTNTGVKWSASGGTITAGGNYTAPTTTGTYTIKATSLADNKTFGSATVTVISAPVLSVTPSSDTMGIGATHTFTATVTGLSDTRTTWQATAGTLADPFQSNTRYFTAPSQAGAVTLSVSSVAEPTVKATVTITVKTFVINSVSITPPNNPETGPAPNPYTVYPFGTVQFSKSVSYEGSATGAVTWAVSAGGGSVDSTGLYTAPATLGTYTITATSTEDSTKKASWGLNVQNATSAWIYRYISSKTVTAPAESVSLTGWFSGTGTINHNVGSVTTGVSKTVTPSVVTNFTLSTVSGKTTASKGLYVAPRLLKGTYSQVNAMVVPRSSYATVSLPTGKILFFGGTPIGGASTQDLDSVEAFDPGTGTYSVLGKMNTQRTQCTATLLADGKVLIVGGMNNSSASTYAAVNFLSTWELFDVVLGKTVRSGYLVQSRTNHAATLLLDGRVLITGGDYYGQYLWQRNTGEIFDPVTSTCVATAGTMSLTSSGHSMTLLPTGKVLISWGGSTGAPDVFNPAAGTFSPLASSGTLTPNQAVGRPTRLIDGTTIHLPSDVDWTSAYNANAGSTKLLGDRVQGALIDWVALPNGKAIGFGLGDSGNVIGPQAFQYDPSLQGHQLLAQVPTGMLDTKGSYSDRAIYLSAVGKVLVATDASSWLVDPGLDLFLDVQSLPLKVGFTRQFVARGPKSAGVTWSVKEGSAGGSITPQGLYTAPQSAGIYHVVATSTSSPTTTATNEVIVIQTAEVISSATIYDFTASPLVLSSGQSTTLTPTFTGGVGVIDNGVGTVLSGTSITVAPAASTTYTLTVTDPGGVAVTKSQTVYLPPIINSFTRTPAVIAPGQYVTLQWSVSGGQVLTLQSTTNGTTSTQDVSGRTSITIAPSATTTYSLVASNPAGGATSAPVSVTVSPIVSISVSPSSLTLAGGGQFQFGVSMSAVAGTDTSVTWSVTGGGTISSTGIFTAPTIPATCVVTATSNVDATRSSSSLVTVTYPNVSLMVSPSTTTIDISQSYTFGYSITTLDGVSKAVNWTVVEGAAGGTISSLGVYVPPTTTGTYHVRATSQANPTVSSTAVVSVVVPNVNVSITPTVLTLEQSGTYRFGFSSTYGGITWSASGGSIDSSGNYIAPITPGVYTVTVTSAVDPSKSAASTVTVTLAGSPRITISPSSMSLFPGGSQTFAASVIGLTNTGVQWSVLESGGGSISQSGAYSAPTAPGTYTVVGTSTSNSQVQTTAKVVVSSVLVFPNDVITAPTFGKQFTASLIPGLNGTLVWSIDEGAVGGSVDSNGYYTPSNTNGIYHIRATVLDASSRAVASGVTEVRNGLISSITISPAITVNQFGVYVIQAQLIAPNGNHLDRVIEQALTSGTQTVSFTFDASEILKLGSPGPYTLGNLVIQLEQDSNRIPVDTSTGLGAISVADPNLFQRPWIRFTGAFSTSGVDLNGNGQIDELDVLVGVETLAIGTFDVSATLVDSNGDDITANYANTQSLQAGANTLVLKFSGKDIAAHGVAGPYRVVNLMIQDKHQEGSLDEVGTISNYSLSQFEGYAAPLKVQARPSMDRKRGSGSKNGGGK